MPDDVTAIPTKLHWLTIADAARLIERRQLSPVELIDALLARIEALDPQLNAFLLPTPEKARGQAKAAEREIMAGRYRGPLHGIPFGLKDIYATAGTQPMEPRSLHRRLVERRRGGSCRRVCPGRARLRYRRFDPRPGGAVRHRRAEADLRARQPCRRLRQFFYLRSCRSDDLGGRRLRDPAAGDCRVRSERSGQRQPPDAGLPGGADRRYSGIADRDRPTSV